MLNAEATPVKPRARPGAAALPRPEAEHGFRPDVQGLRAIAVGLVVLYHLYPKVVTGGYVGVDVFFVISGFLITSHLARGLERKRRVSLLDFYGRRARRLLPAASVVLLACWGLSRWLLPATQIPAAEDQIRASALYFQNWVLAHDSVSYLHSEDAPSPVQHFWSLSVEEQFYLVWPWLFVAAAAVTALVVRRRRAASAGGHAAPADPQAASRTAGRATLFVLALAVVGTSLAYSVYKTNTDPAAAYFVTTTRMWELGLGGLLALMPAVVTRRLARVGMLAWVGLAMIIWATVTLSGSSAFPGWVAILPTLGAVLMIACGSSAARLGTGWFTSSRPFVFLGDISYSLYLWHWPLIVFWLAYAGGSIGILDGPAIAAVAIVLSWLTKKFVEDPVRRAPLVVRHRGVSLATAFSVVVPAVLVTAFGLTPPAPFTGHLNHTANPGAAALVNPATPTPHAAIVPDPAAVGRDIPLLSHNGCEVSTYDPTPKLCTFGDTTNPTLKVALVGDSHAAEWSSALDAIAKQQHWEMVGAVHAACHWTSVLTTVTSHNTPFTACQQWGQAVLNDLINKVKPDVVITTERPSWGTVDHPAQGPAAWAQVGQGMVDYLNILLQHGIKVVAIHESPEPGVDAGTCLTERGGSISKCSVPASKALWQHTPIDVAKQLMGNRLPVVNMNDLICSPSVCAPVVGNVVVYRDSHHLAKTFTMTLAPFLKQRLLATGAFAVPKAKSDAKASH